MERIIRYEVTAPKHGKYKSAAVELEFKENVPAVLKKMNFVIDGKHFFTPMGKIPATKGVLTAWIFQNKLAISKLSGEELDLIASLCTDVADNYCTSLPNTYEKLLRSVEAHTKMYAEFSRKDLPAGARKKLFDEFVKSNTLITSVAYTRRDEMRREARLEFAKKMREERLP